MNKEILKKLMNLLPESERKQELVQKYQRLNTKSEKRGGDGLKDTFEFQTKGHITIEQIDEKGKVVGVLADQPNLVVDGAEEILLRAFSGDPNRILYKNRKVKDPTGISSKIYISESKLGGLPLFDGNQLLHAPNVLWTEVDDELFETTFGYYPETVYLKEEVSTEVGKKAFSISNKTAADRVPMSSEIYSTYSNLFIGIGEGINRSIPLTDARLTKTEEFTVDAQRAETTVEGEEIIFTQKISNFEVDVESSDTGAQIDVYINGELKETIESYNSGLSTPSVVTFDYNGLDYETETTVRLVHSGSDEAVTTAKMAIVGLRFDALSKSDNGLMSEFKNFETDFLTPTAFRTTPMAPYTIQLPHFPLKEDTVKINYEGQDFTEVDEEASLTPTSFVVDHLRGIVTFNRALTGVMTTFSSTGELYDTELVSTMTAYSLVNSTETVPAQTYKLAYPASVGTVNLVGEDGVAFEEVIDKEDFGPGKVMINPSNAKQLIVSKTKADGEPLLRVEVTYRSDERPGVPTGYTRAIIEKPKTTNEYPWFELDRGSVRFVAEFPESIPVHNVTIREMGLFDGPRAEDKVAGFPNYPVKAFSLVRVGETRKEANTGIRITWTITLLNSENQPFKGGSN